MASIVHSHRHTSVPTLHRPNTEPCLCMQVTPVFRKLIWTRLRTRTGNRSSCVAGRNQCSIVRCSPCSNLSLYEFLKIVLKASRQSYFAHSIDNLYVSINILRISLIFLIFLEFLSSD